MKKEKSIIILVIILIMSLFVIGAYFYLDSSESKKIFKPNTKEALKEDTTEELKVYNVIFDSNGGSIVEMQKINENDKVTKPTDPVRTGYTFVEWDLDDKSFDFDTSITSNITLKAKWEKEKTTTKTETSKSSGTTSSSKNTKPSTIDNINLNENMGVSIYSTIGGVVYDYMFITNLNEVFPNIKGTTFTIDNPNGDSQNVISYEDWENNFSKLKFDTEKENKAMQEFEKLKNEKYKGIGNFNATIRDHYIDVYYFYLQPSDTKYYKDIYEGLKNIKKTYDGRINGILSGAYKVGVGGAGNEPYLKVMNSKICDYFGFTCSEW